jgi:hypothetical protein
VWRHAQRAAQGKQQPRQTAVSEFPWFHSTTPYFPHEDAEIDRGLLKKKKRKKKSTEAFFFPVIHISLALAPSPALECGLAPLVCPCGVVRACGQLHSHPASNDQQQVSVRLLSAGERTAKSTRFFWLDWAVRAQWAMAQLFLFLARNRVQNVLKGSKLAPPSS